PGRRHDEAALLVRLDLTDQPGQQVLSRNRGAADDELAAQPALQLIERLPRLARESQDPPGVPEHQLAGARGRGAPPEAVEKLYAELVLEGANVLGDRGLGQEEGFGGAREAPELGHLRKDLEAAQIHQSETGVAGLLSDRRNHRRSTRRRPTWGTAGARRRS